MVTLYVDWERMRAGAESAKPRRDMAKNILRSYLMRMDVRQLYVVNVVNRVEEECKRNCGSMELKWNIFKCVSWLGSPTSTESKQKSGGKTTTLPRKPWLHAQRSVTNSETRERSWVISWLVFTHFWAVSLHFSCPKSELPWYLQIATNGRASSLYPISLSLNARQDDKPTSGANQRSSGHDPHQRSSSVRGVVVEMSWETSLRQLASPVFSGTWLELALVK